MKKVFFLVHYPVQNHILHLVVMSLLFWKILKPFFVFHDFDISEGDRPVILQKISQFWFV